MKYCRLKQIFIPHIILSGFFKVQLIMAIVLFRLFFLSYTCNWFLLNHKYILINFVNIKALPCIKNLRFVLQCSYVFINSAYAWFFSNFLCISRLVKVSIQIWLLMLVFGNFNRILPFKVLSRTWVNHLLNQSNLIWVPYHIYHVSPLFTFCNLWIYVKDLIFLKIKHNLS